MIEKPTKEELDRLVEEGSTNRTADEWIASMLQAVRSTLIRNPKRYRGYGPYWWLVKKMFIDAGDLAFGEHLDAQWIEALDYGSAKHNMAAAFAYEDARFLTMHILEATHTLIDDGNPVEFVSSDEEMELR